MQNFDFYRATTIDEARQLLQKYGGEAKLIAGGCALINLMKLELFQPEALIDVMGIENLRFVRVEADTSLRLGALNRLSRLERLPEVREHAPFLVDVLHEVASPRIRNRITLGGALCHGEPASDVASALIALGASVTVVGSQGTRQLPVQDLFVDYYETCLEPDEILTEVLIPPKGENFVSRYIKFAPRKAADYALVGVAVALNMSQQGSGKIERAGIGLASVAPTPLKPLRAVEALQGNEFSEEILREAGRLAAEETMPAEDFQFSEEYKRDMVAVLVRRAVMQALGIDE